MGKKILRQILLKNKAPHPQIRSAWVPSLSLVPKYNFKGKRGTSTQTVSSEPEPTSTYSLNQPQICWVLQDTHVWSKELSWPSLVIPWWVTTSEHHLCMVSEESVWGHIALTFPSGPWSRAQPGKSEPVCQGLAEWKTAGWAIGAESVGQDQPDGQPAQCQCGGRVFSLRNWSYMPQGSWGKCQLLHHPGAYTEFLPVRWRPQRLWIFLHSLVGRRGSSNHLRIMMSEARGFIMIHMEMCPRYKDPRLHTGKQVQCLLTLLPQG